MARSIDTYVARHFREKRPMFNSEELELEKAQRMSLTVCRMSMDTLPVTAARPSLANDSNICLSYIELSPHCVPTGTYDFWKRHMCLHLGSSPDLEQMQLLDYTTTLPKDWSSGIDSFSMYNMSSTFHMLIFVFTFLIVKIYSNIHKLQI